MEVMKITETSFKRYHVHTATLSALNPVEPTTDPYLCQRLLDTSQANLDQSLVGVTVSFSWVLVCTRFCLCPPRVYFPSPVEVLAALWWGLWQPRPRGLMPHSGLLHREPLPLRQATADPDLQRRHSYTVLPQSLWGPWVLVCIWFV